MVQMSIQPPKLSTSPDSTTKPNNKSAFLRHQINKKGNTMNTKTLQIIYWTGVILTSLWFGTSGICELTHNPLVWDITVKLGYPPHFIYILGVAKLTGVAVLLIPNKLLRLKEWVFAGICFDILFAFFSKIAVFGFSATIDAIIAFSMVTITYLAFRKLYPNTIATAPSF